MSQLECKKRERCTFLLSNNTTRTILGLDLPGNLPEYTEYTLNEKKIKAKVLRQNDSFSL